MASAGFVFSLASKRVSRAATSRRLVQTMTSPSSPADPSSSFRIALLQIAVGADKKENVDRARKNLLEASAHGVRLAMLPECFNSPYDTKCFPDYAEEVPGIGTLLSDAVAGSTISMLQEVAAERKIYIVGGSVPERDGDRIYNTSVSVDPEGTIVAKHRKVHLFDIDVPGGIRFKESDVLSPGNSSTVFDMGDCKVAVAICYDIRFAELSLLLAKEGAKLLCLPGAFNMTTGPAHWELLMRSRALDNQMYVAACSPARDDAGSYVAWGHSMVCDPWGAVLASAAEGETIVYADIDLSRLETVRTSIPLTKQKRPDLYTLART